MGSRGLDLLALPEDCIANVLSLSGPRDTCRLSVISSLFRSAAESDAVWQKHLPPDYRSIIARSTDPYMLTRFSSLKDLYFSLCDNPILIDDAKLSFSLDKSTGKKCYMVSARNLVIVWGDTPWYWKWTSEPECRFGGVAELVQVCWLEIRGKICASLLSPATLYSAYLVFKSATETYVFDYGPLEVSMGLAGAESPTRSVYLDARRGRRQRYQTGRGRIGLVSRKFMSGMKMQAPVPVVESDGGMQMQAPGPVVESDGPYPRERKDGWLEIELGEFYNKEGEEGEIEMSVLEIKDGNWKGGLIVQGIEIRPKEGK
ncbi:hypothetical protein K2173_025637 [Erythroxylum novogranatense]|uniref:F-box domain-containing protein n=1 Tax=Erythroxylum novogranatense TaxID=1862640 RepID=A0AAV8SNQ0_9ROSI|nr:hypothetical protein K2173_025637 [Erythroxylum novogranatense]